MLTCSELTVASGEKKKNQIAYVHFSFCLSFFSRHPAGSILLTDFVKNIMREADQEALMHSSVRL